MDLTSDFCFLPKMVAQSFVVDLNKALVFQVGHLGEAYEEWVHQPIVGKEGPRFFENEVLEFLTRTVWWAIPVIWLPVVCWCVYNSAQMGVSCPHLALVVVFGIFVWTFLEYTLHRFLFHIKTKTYWGNTIHYLLHGCHHKHPMDGLRLVFPPAATAILLIPFWNFVKLISTPSIAPALLGGGLLGYVMYDCTHYYLHHGQPKTEVPRNLKKYHLNHHFRIQNKGFGITSSLWDKVFGTLPPSKVDAKSLGILVNEILDGSSFSYQFEEMAEEQSSNPEPTNDCCAEWKAKCAKMKEGRNALRKAVKLLEVRTNEFKSQNEQLMKAIQEEQERAKTEKLEKLKESNVRISLETEVSALKSEIAILQNKSSTNDKEGDGGVKSLLACISDKEIEINKFKQLWEREAKIANTERKIAEKEKRNAAEIQKLLESERKKSFEKENGEVKALQACVFDKEKEINRLKELFEQEKIRADTERKNANKEKNNADEARKLLEAEKKKSAVNYNGDVKVLQGCIYDKEKEIARLKDLFEQEWIRAETERKNADKEKNNAAEAWKLLEAEKKKSAVKDNGDVKVLQACISDKEKEIARLKDLFEQEKIRAESERKNADKEKNNAAEAWKLLEAEKKKSAVKDNGDVKVLQACISDKEKEIARLKDLFEQEKIRAESERKNADKEKNNAAEAWKLLETKKKKSVEKEIGDMKVLQACISDKEKEINRLKQFLERETIIANTERKIAEKEKRNADEVQKLLEEKKKSLEKENEDVKVLQACISDKEKEINNRLKELFEQEKIRADTERKNANKEKNNAAEARKSLEAEKKKSAVKDNGDVKVLQACISDNEKEINRLKQILEREKIIANTERKIAEKEKRNTAEPQKLLEVEKKKSKEVMQLIEAKKAEEYKLQQVDLQKEVSEAKKKLDFETKKFREASRRFADEKQKLLGEKGIAYEAMAKAQRSLEVEKEKAAKEKKRADIEVAKVKEQKTLAENNLKRVRETKSLVDQMSQKLQEDKQTIEEMKQKIDELSSQRKPKEKAGDSSYVCVNAESARIQFLEESLKLESSRVKHEKKKYKLEATRCRLLQHELGRLKLDFNKFFLRLNALDTFSTPVPESKHGQTKPQNMPNMQNSNAIQVENEHMKACSTSMCAFDRLKKNMQHTPLLASSGVNIAESITGIGSNLGLPLRGSKRIKLQSSAITSNATSFANGQLIGLQKGGALQVIASSELAVENLNARPSMSNPSDSRKRKRIRDTVECTASLCRKKEMEVIKVIAREYANDNGCSTCHALHTPRTTEACRDRRFDTPNYFHSMISFDKVGKLLDLQKAADEECYERALNVPLSPYSLANEMFYMDNPNSSLEETLSADLLSQRDLSPSGRCVGNDVGTSSKKRKFDGHTAPSCTHHKPFQARKIGGKLPYMHTPVMQLPDFCFVFSNIEDDGSLYRVFHATKNCIARCNLDTQTDWAVANILIAIEAEELLLQKEKHSVLLTLLLFNFSVTTTMKFGKIWDGGLILCLNSYVEHIRKVTTDAETRIQFSEKNSVHELLCLIEDFLIEGKVKIKNIAPTQTTSQGDLRTDNFLDSASTLSSKVASSEQLVAGSIILASLCVATGHIGFLFQASYNILRLGKWDCLMMLTILHIFAYLGGGKFFELGNFGLMVTVLKSLVMFLEDGGISVTDACLPSLNQLHSELCASICPFSEGVESIDIVTSLLLEKIKNCPLQRVGQFNAPNFRLLSDNHNAGQRSIQEVVQCARSISCDVSCRLKKRVIYATQSDVAVEVSTCDVSDILSLLELVANKMGWQWTSIMIVPQLLKMLNSCELESSVAAIVVLLDQLGRLGVSVGGYENRGVENLRHALISYFSRNSSVKASPSLHQIAIVVALFGVLPLDVESLLQTKFSLPTCSNNSISEGAEILRKWFSGLDKDQQDLIFGILRHANVC
ncbi:hypothetical protein RIF29_41034 [Crotalaria pallida]|uniref:Fatty acid hydroxylase domain-containing protein n=1 Tax=Crotalaria pallida TaxID=3830 RepID=A0AAN9E4L7_CROPI